MHIQLYAYFISKMFWKTLQINFSLLADGAQAEVLGGIELRCTIYFEMCQISDSLMDEQQEGWIYVWVDKFSKQEW